MGVHNEVLVLGGSELRVPHHQQKLMVQVVEAGPPCAATQGCPNRELVADRRQLGRQHDNIGRPVLPHDGGQESSDIPQQLRRQTLSSGRNVLDKVCVWHQGWGRHIPSR